MAANNFQPAQEDADPFDSLLDLEATYHAEGHALGVADGSRAGRIEGRVFGLEKGFEKFSEMGRLGGQAAVWGARIEGRGAGPDEGRPRVRPLNGSERLRRHVRRLRELADPETLVMENGEEAVSAVEDRLKDARAKATLVRKADREEVVGEDERPGAAPSRTPAKSLKVRRDDEAKKSGEMEDFVGLPQTMKKKV